MPQSKNNGTPFQTSSKTKAGSSFDAVQNKENNIVGKKLTEARKALKLSQKDLAARLTAYNVQLSAGAISKWEKGDTMPNPYQLLALCYALDIDGFSYFTGLTSESSSFTAGSGQTNLNQEGLHILQIFKDALIACGQYSSWNPMQTAADTEQELFIKVFDEPAAAGPGNPLLSGSYEMISYPASLIPKGTSFGIRVSGSSMYPRYVDRQVVYVEQTSEIYNGEIGVFYYDGEAYIKKYIVEKPLASEAQDYITENGISLPKITLYSLNRDCSDLDIHITPGHDFQIIGRVLN